VPDEYLLFSDLPFDFQVALPLEFGNGVFLDNPRPAYTAVDAEEGLPTLATPERYVGMGELHVSLRRSHTRRIGSEKARDDLWLALLALRLARPIHFRTTASLAVENESIAGTGISQSTLEARINSTAAAPLTAAIVAQARRINLRIKTLRGIDLERVRSALILFSHVTTGRVMSWQLCALGLFGCLECVLPQPAPGQSTRLNTPGETYGARLARRVNTFLQPIRRPARFQASLADAYKSVRNPLAHGFHDASFGGRGVNALRARLLLRLHETARLTLLGFLGFSNAQLRTLLPLDAARISIQNGIDRVGQAPLLFLAGQRFWT
jgi:hypothetical protein